MEKEYYRTFIGLPVSVGDGFLTARRELKESLSRERISWVDPERFHITLMFLGDTKLSTVAQISTALDCVKVPKKTRVRMTHPGSFGPRKSPRVIWVGFEHSALFEVLKNDIDRALGSCGISSADQPFRAHLTLGRVRSIKDLNGYYETIAAMKNRFSYELLFSRLIFYRSELGIGMPVYTPLRKIEFGD